MIVTLDATSISMPMRDSPTETSLRTALPRHLQRCAITPDVRDAIPQLTVYDAGLSLECYRTSEHARGNNSGRQVVAVSTTHTRPPAARPPAASDTATASTRPSCTPMTRLLDGIPACDLFSRSMSLSAPLSLELENRGPESPTAAGWNLGRENRIAFSGCVHN